MSLYFQYLIPSLKPGHMKSVEKVCSEKQSEGPIPPKYFVYHLNRAVTCLYKSFKK